MLFSCLFLCSLLFSDWILPCDLSTFNIELFLSAGAGMMRMGVLYSRFPQIYYHYLCCICCYITDLISPQSLLKFNSALSLVNRLIKQVVITVEQRYNEGDAWQECIMLSMGKSTVSLERLLYGWGYRCNTS